MSTDRENAQVALVENERRPVTVNQHKLFIDSLLTPADHDEIDSLVEELRAGEFEERASQP